MELASDLRPQRPQLQETTCGLGPKSTKGSGHRPALMPVGNQPSSIRGALPSRSPSQRTIFFVELGMEPGASCMLGKHSTSLILSDV